MRVQRGVVSLAHDACVCLSPLKWQFMSVESRNYFDTCGVGSSTHGRAWRQKKAPALPERCTARAKHHLRSLKLKVGSLEHQDVQVWSRAHPLRPTRTVSSRSRECFRDFLRALWRRGREVCSPASRQGILRTRRGAHGEVFFGASRRVRGREARRGLQPGDVRSSLRQRGEVCSPATSEVLFGARRRARAQRRAICSPARCSACRRGRRRGGLQVHNPASWRCVPRCVSAWAKARWPE